MEYEYRKTKKFILHDFVVSPLEDFVTQIVNAGMKMVFWHNGVLFYMIPFDSSETYKDKLAEGEEEHIFALYVTKSEKIRDTYD